MATKRNSTRATLAPADPVSYEVIHPVTHDGEEYLPGDDIVLDADAAGPLLNVGAIKAPKSAAAAEAS
jgi:hypothetical protein